MQRHQTLFDDSLELSSHRSFELKLCSLSLLGPFPQPVLQPPCLHFLHWFIGGQMDVHMVDSHSSVGIYYCARKLSAKAFDSATRHALMKRVLLLVWKRTRSHISLGNSISKLIQNFENCSYLSVLAGSLLFYTKMKSGLRHQKGQRKRNGVSKDF